MKQTKMRQPGHIRIVGARENNLKNVSLDIPKHEITVFTGVSGSGKSSLVFDTIAAESQRQLNETFTSFVRNRLPHYGQPDADKLENLSTVIVVDQKRLGGNSRSTVGTITDIYSLLRLLFSRMGGPSAGESTAYSFNDPKGMCMECAGTGKTSTLDIDRLIDLNKSLNEGPFRFPAFSPGTWYWKYFVKSGLFDNDKKLKDYTKQELEDLLYRDDNAVSSNEGEKGKKKPYNPLMVDDGGVGDAIYEALVPKFERTFLKKEASSYKGERREAFEYIVTQKACPVCDGARLNRKALDSKIRGKNIAECAALQLDVLLEFMSSLESRSAATVIEAVKERLHQTISIGLGYLSLDRETTTLSGGESQRVKMVRHLGSSLVDMVYIFDEPSVGLHPRDVSRLNELIIGLRDKGNTILIVEHDPDVIAIADHIVDVGPLAGESGGEIVFQGSLKALMKADTLTGKFLQKRNSFKIGFRNADGFLEVKNARLHNLKNVNVKIPKGVLTVVTGVAGSGKSSLINSVLAANYPEIISIDQKAIQGSRRSNAATFTGILDSIRKLFGQANNVKPSLFSFNSEGACPECNGLGEIVLDLAFMDSVATPCDLCQGKRFTDKTLGYKLRGKNIYEVLMMSVSQAKDFFDEKSILSVLERLIEVGLGYVTLGQSLDTFSGGERQRLKLAVELHNTGQVYTFDEPTTGLHMCDVERLLKLLNQIVDDGSTVIVIEHNLEVISQADWIIDIGPQGGKDGGEVVFEGTVDELVKTENSLTGKFLKAYLTAPGFKG